MSTDVSERLSTEQFHSLFHAVRTWGRWGALSKRGALNALTPDRVVHASSLVQAGTTVSLSHLLATTRRLDCPVPAEHRMTLMPDVDIGIGRERFAKDYVGVDYHNDGHSHIDAFCHVSFQGRLYDGVPDSTITPRGAQAGAIDLLAGGLVGRGVLLDVPRLRGVPWLEPGEHVFRADLERAEHSQGVDVEAGDVLLVRTGLPRRLAELGPWDTTQVKAGLHPTVATYLSERQVTAVGSDGNNDTAPSCTDRVAFPIHVLALNAMGVHLLDYLQLDELARQCEAAGRWQFLLVVAPLRIPGGTGSPVNPVAVF